MSLNHGLPDQIEVEKIPPPSPKWNNNTKLLVGISFVAVTAYLLIQFHNLIGPLLIAFILAYLFYPVCRWMVEKLRFSWSLAVTLVFLLLLIALLGLLTWGGLAILDQITSLVAFLEEAVTNLPEFITKITSAPLQIGPFQYDLGRLDLSAVTNQVLSTVQPILTQIGSLVGTVATSAVTTIGWILFILLIAFFILRETGGGGNSIIDMRIPGYTEDLRRLGKQLSLIWDTFLRGQLLIVGLVIVVYTILLGGLQVKYFFGLAVLAGLARFVPYVGPFVAWSTYGLVSYFQGTTIFGLSPFGYALMIVAVAWVTDAIMDNMVNTPLLAGVLNIHPAAVMVAALVALNLLGMTGVVLAAPVLATLKLVVTYAGRKFFDLDPWLGMPAEVPSPPAYLSLRHHLRNLGKFILRVMPATWRERLTRNEPPKE